MIARSRFRPATVLGTPIPAVALVATAAWAATALFFRPIGDYGVETDFYGDFYPYAMRWMHGEATVMNGFRGPFYYLVLGVVSTLLRNGFLAAKLISVLSAGASVLLVGRMFERLWGPKAGLLGALFVAGNATLVPLAFRAGTDTLFLLLTVSALTLMLRGGEGRVREWALAGAAGGAAYLTRYNGAALLPVGLLVAALTLRPWRRVAHASLFFVGAFALLIAPWLVFLRARMGDPFWSNAYMNTALSLFTESPAKAQTGRFMVAVDFASMGEVIRCDPPLFLRMLAQNALTHAKLDALRLVGIPGALLALAGLLLGWRTWLTRRRLAFAGSGAIVYLSMLLVFYDPRFMLPLVLWWAAAAAGVAAGLDGLRAEASVGPVNPRRRAPTRRGRIVFLAVVGLFLAAAIWVNVRAIRSAVRRTGPESPPAELLELAQSARRAGLRIGESTPIAARKPHIGYLLGAPVIPIPMGGVNELREAGGHYLLVSGMEVGAFPGLQSLYAMTDPGAAARGLELVARVSVAVDASHSRRALLFRVNDPKPWAPAPRVERPAVRTVLPGLSRIDTLRLLVARWRQAWEPDRSVAPLLESMTLSARGHPDVLVVLGNEALRQHDLQGAERLYSEAARSEPHHAHALLRMACVRHLAGDDAGAARMVEEYAKTVAGPSTAGGRVEWKALVDELRSKGDYSAALGACGGWALERPDEASLFKYVGILTYGVGWPDRAEPALRRSLELTPNDREAALILEGLVKGSVK